MLAAIEQAILDDAKQTFGTTVREYQTLPGAWTLDMLKRALQFAPGIYVGFIGLLPTPQRNSFNARFGVYVVTKGVKEPQRRKGNPREIGAYDMILGLLNRFAALRIEGAGGVHVTSVDNLFSDVLFDLGGTVFGITLEVRNLIFDGCDDDALSALADFITFDAQYDLDSELIAHDIVTLQDPPEQNDAPDSEDGGENEEENTDE